MRKWIPLLIVAMFSRLYRSTLQLNMLSLRSMFFTLNRCTLQLNMLGRGNGKQKMLDNT